MRGLTVCCFVIASLAFANTEVVTKVYKYEYDKYNLIHSDNPLTDNHLVYGVCEGKEVEKKCKIYQESILDNTQATKSCDINLSYIISAFGVVNLQKVGKDYVVAAFKGEGQNNLFTVNMNSCTVKETSVKTDIDSSVIIVPKDGNYDVIFKNNKLCNDVYCKATYDYDGKIVKEAAAFGGIKIAIGSLNVNTAGRGFLVGEKRKDDQINIYFVPGDDQQSKMLFSTPDGSRGDLYSLSTEENKLSLCMTFESMVQCQQYDADGKTRIFQIEYPITAEYFKLLDVLNLENGLLMVSIEYPKGSSEPSTSIIKYDAQSKRIKRLINTDLNCSRSDHFTITKLYKNFRGEYCVASVCRKYLLESFIDSEFTLTNTCFAKSVLA